jgi:hypothetical protein
MQALEQLLLWKRDGAHHAMGKKRKRKVGKDQEKLREKKMGGGAPQNAGGSGARTTCTAKGGKGRREISNRGKITAMPLLVTLQTNTTLYFT